MSEIPTAAGDTTFDYPIEFAIHASHRNLLSWEKRIRSGIKNAKLVEFSGRGDGQMHFRKCLQGKLIIEFNLDGSFLLKFWLDFEK